MTKKSRYITNRSFERTNYQSGSSDSIILPIITNVTITGTEVVNNNLTVSYTLTGGLADTVTREWYRGVTLIFTSTSSDTYTLTQSDAGNTSNISCKIIASNAAGSVNLTSNTITVIYDAMAWDYRNRVIVAGSTMSLTRLQLLQGLVIIPCKTILEKINFGAGVNKGALHIYTAENTTQALINILNPNFTTTTINTPTFTTNSFYTGGPGIALNSNWNPSILSLGTNDIIVAAGFNNISSLTYNIVGVQSSTSVNSIYTYADATQVGGRMLTSSENPTNLANSRIGWHSMRRLGNNIIWNNNTNQVSVNNPAAGIFANLNLYDLALSVNNTVSFGSNVQQCFAIKGGYITDSELSTLRTAIKSYCLTVNPTLAI